VAQSALLLFPERHGSSDLHISHVPLHFDHQSTQPSRKKNNNYLNTIIYSLCETMSRETSLAEAEKVQINVLMKRGASNLQIAKTISRSEKVI
jgi:hypothetical protein